MYEECAIAYVRCSTDKQDTSVSQQEEAIREYARNQKLKIVSVFKDDGVSGTSAEGRPGFMAMINLIKNSANTFTKVLVYDVSRWGRFSNPKEATYWEVEVEKHDRQVVYVAGGFANDGSIGSYVTKVIKDSEASEFSKKQRQLVIRGSITHTELGHSVGGVAPYGMKRVLVDRDGNCLRDLAPGERKSEKTERVKIAPGDPIEIATVKRIFNCYVVEMMGYRNIMNMLNHDGIKTPSGGSWSSSSIREILHNPVYKGWIVWNRTKKIRVNGKRSKRLRPESEWKCKKDAHDAIIPAEIFDKAQERRAPNPHKEYAVGEDKPLIRRSGYGENGKPYKLSGLIKCLRCGNNFHGHVHTARGVKHYYYECGGYAMKGEYVCRFYSVERDLLENFVLEGINMKLRGSKLAEKVETKFRKLVENLWNNSPDVAGEIKRKLADNTRKVNNLLENVEIGKYGDLVNERLERLSKEKAFLENELDAIGKRAKSKEDMEGMIQRVLKYLYDIKALLKAGTYAQQREIIRCFAPKIDVNPDKDEVIIWYYPIPRIEEVKQLVSDSTVPEAGFEPARALRPAGF